MNFLCCHDNQKTDPASIPVTVRGRSNTEATRMCSMYQEPQHGMKELILQVVKSQSADDESAPPAEFTDVHHLRLQYKDIKHIEGLWGFTSLTKLELNNNLIDRILGLDHLINLKKLDLSFNRIKKIEGLQALQKLTSLNLSNNKIAVIENLEAIEDLTHFFFANNLLEQLDNLVYLRRFKNIFTINLIGNPVTDDKDYKHFIAAYFPNLKFLDHSIPDEATKKEAYEKYQHVLDKIKIEELEIETRRSQEAELKLHKDAFVEFLNGSGLFESLFEDDPETETLHGSPGVPSLLKKLKIEITPLCTQLFEIGLAEYKRRESKVNCLRSGLSEMTGYRQEQSQMVETFDREHRKRITELQQLSAPEAITIKIDHCNAEINHLYKSLMTLQLEHIRQVKMHIEEFNNNISEMVANFIETAEGIFVQCRKLEIDYYWKVKEAAQKTLAKVANNNQDKDMADDVIMLFSDKEAVNDILTTCHDNHIGKLNDRETELVTRINAWKVTLIKEIQDKELRLHRNCVSDFRKQKDEWTEQLKKFQKD